MPGESVCTGQQFKVRLELNRVSLSRSPSLSVHKFPSNYVTCAVRRGRGKWACQDLILPWNQTESLMRSQQKCWPFSTLFALLRSLCGCLCCWLLWLLFVARGSQGGTNKLRCRVARYVRTSSPRPTRLITILFGFVALTFNLLCKDFPQHTHTHAYLLCWC